MTSSKSGSVTPEALAKQERKVERTAAARVLEVGHCASEKKTEAQGVKQLAPNHTIRNSDNVLHTRPPDPKAYTFIPVRSRHPSGGTGTRKWHGQQCHHSSASQSPHPSLES